MRRGGRGGLRPIAATGALDEAREQALGYVAEAKQLHLAGSTCPTSHGANALHLVADGV